MKLASFSLSSKIYRVLASLWILVISYLSLGRISVSEKGVSIQNLDKLAHFLMYFGLTYLLLKSFPQISKWWIFGFAALFGFLMEYAQLKFTDYRNFDMYDLIANIIGALVCTLLLKRF